MIGMQVKGKRIYFATVHRLPLTVYDLLFTFHPSPFTKLRGLAISH